MSGNGAHTRGRGWGSMATRSRVARWAHEATSRSRRPSGFGRQWAHEARRAAIECGRPRAVGFSGGSKLWELQAYSNVSLRWGVGKKLGAPWAHGSPCVPTPDPRYPHPMVPSRHAWAIRGYAVGSWMEADIHGGKNWVQGPCRYGIDSEDQTWDVRSPPCVPGCMKPPCVLGAPHYFPRMDRLSWLNG